MTPRPLRAQPFSSHSTAAPRLGRRERRSAELRERIFRAALRLFAEKGFEQTAVEDITEAADVGKGTFFNYFPSKDHILVAFGEMQIAKLQGLVEEAWRSNEPLPQFLRRLGSRMTEEPARNPAIVRTILRANLSSDPVRHVMRKLHRRGWRLLGKLVQLGQQQGQIRSDRSAVDIARVFQQMVWGTLLMWTVHTDTPLKDRIDDAFEVLWNGLRPASRLPRSRRTIPPNEEETP